MIDPRRFHQDFIRPNLVILNSVTGIPCPPAADRMLLAIAMQETNLNHRYQVGSSTQHVGPAKGWWQFERGGGVAGVMQHNTTKREAQQWTELCDVEFDSHCIWRALEGHDQLAVGFARLLLWTSPNPLPETSAEGWLEYLSVWRPGKPHKERWGANWHTADLVVKEDWK